MPSIPFVRSTDAPTHAGRFRTPDAVRGALAAPPGGSFLPDVIPGARQVIQAAFNANLEADPSGWTWYDITADVQWEPGVNITIAQQDESSPTVGGIRPAGFTAKLLNTDDQYTVDNVFSPHWPGVAENTPVRAILDIGTGEYTRFFGYANGWSPVPGGTNPAAFVALSASGVLRRIRQGKGRQRSAYERWIFDINDPDEPHPLPVEWWPLEEGYGATGGLSGLGDGHGVMAPLTGTHPSGAIITYPEWGSGRLAPWLPPVISRSGNVGLTVLWAPVNMPDFDEEWVVEYLYNSGSDAGESTVDINPSYLAGGAAGWPQLTLTPQTQEVKVSFNGEPETSADVPQLYDNNIHHIRWVAYQDGANVSWYVQLDGVDIVNSGTTAGAMTLTAINNFGTAADAQSGASLAQGHFTIWYEPGWPSSDAALGYPGETIVDRLTRVCRQDKITLDVVGESDTLLGPQPTGTLLDIAEDARKAEDGLVIDGLGPGLTLICRTSAYSLPASMTLDASLGQFDPPLPRHDDQGRCNLFKATQAYTNISKTFELTEGDLATGRVGTYDSGDTINLYSAGDLLSYASWRVYTSTPTGVRYPSLTLQLMKESVASLGPLWLGMLPWVRFDLTNMSSGPTTRRMLLRGWGEKWNSKVWSVTLNCSSYEPYAVTVIAAETGDTGEFVGWIDTDGTDIASDVAIGASSISVTVHTGPLWSTDADDCPQEIKVRGIDITVTAIAGTTAAQTFTVDPATVTKALYPGDPVHVSHPPVPGR